MATKKTATTDKTTKAKATTKRKAKTETEQAQANLDDALVEKKPAKAKKPVKQKSAQEELFDLVETYETGRKIGQAAVDTPALGLAIGIGAAVALWSKYQQSKEN